MYFFYLGDILLPVTPDNLQTKIKNQNKAVNLISGEEINIPYVQGLCEFSFKCLLPNKSYPFSVYQNGFLGAQYFIDEFYKLKASCKPFLFVVKRDSDDFSMEVTLEDYQITENASDGMDFSVDVNVKQYVGFGTVSLSIAQNNEAVVSVEREDFSQTQKKYIIQDSDNLWSIAARFLGNGSRSVEIYNLNSEILDATAKKYGKRSSESGWWIYSGTEIMLPDK